MDDPVPIELKRTVKEKQSLHAVEKATGIINKKMRTLKDKEKVIYAPFCNLGALNFEKTTGYITIPDSQVIYTRTDGIGAGLGNEGQQMMWKLQDIEAIERQDEEQVQLLPGIDIGISEKRAARRVMNPEVPANNVEDVFKTKEK